jgi:hypothetical protein
MVRFAGLLAALLLISSPAYAYIDPGILGVLYQAAYALVFGAFVALVLRPWQYLKGVFARLSGRTRSADDHAHARGTAEGDRDRR